MPAGIHKGKRVVLTLDQEIYDQWVKIAELLDVPVATAIRQSLEESTPLMADTLLGMKDAKNKGLTLDDYMGRAVWGLMKEMMEANKKND